MKGIKLVFVILVKFSIVSVSLAQVPLTMNYQGKITDLLGVAVNGTCMVDFRIYNESTYGTPLWGETLSVYVSKGLFDAQLGNHHSIDLDFSEPYWMEIFISTDRGASWDTLEPREKLATVSYAFRSIYSDTAVYLLSTPLISLILPYTAEICTGEDLILNGNPAGGSGIYSNHLWIGDTIPLSATNIPNPVFNTGIAGSYNLTYTVTDDSGAQSSDVVTITVITIPSINTHPLDESVEEGNNARISVVASGGGLTYQWQENNRTAWYNIIDGGTEPVYSGTNTPGLYLNSIPLSYNGYKYRCTITNKCGTINSDSANLTVAWEEDVCGENVVLEVTSPGTGTTWMDRNLGASQQATAYNDHQAYGALFQWGRLSDGHECINWTDSSSGTPLNDTTHTTSSSDNPGHSLFITNSSIPFDWRIPQNYNLWQGVGGINNPCPAGYRLPTGTEFQNELDSWISEDRNGAYASPLKLVAAGLRHHNNGSLQYQGLYGYYWCSTFTEGQSEVLEFDGGGASGAPNNRGFGCCVRCIKD